MLPVPGAPGVFTFNSSSAPHRKLAAYYAFKGEPSAPRMGTGSFAACSERLSCRTRAAGHTPHACLARCHAARSRVRASRSDTRLLHGRLHCEIQK